MFGKKENDGYTPITELKTLHPTPLPVSIQKLRAMTNQLNVWVETNEIELANKHWQMISEYCKSQISVKNEN